jgi:hypothetical protein
MSRQSDSHVMSTIETAGARNLRDYVATFRQVEPGVEAECIAVADGVAAFTGVGSPLTTVKGVAPHLAPHDLDEIESFFLDHKATTVTIEMAPWLTTECERALSRRGYRGAGEESVMTVTSDGRRSRSVARADDVPADAWPGLMRQGFQLPDESPMIGLVTVAAHLPHAQRFGIRDNDRWIACAQAITYEDVVIFCNDATVPEERGRGAQTALIEERLEAVPPGMTATAEVAPGSGSERNYLRCGFRIAYARTHYVRDVSRTHRRGRSDVGC